MQVDGLVGYAAAVLATALVGVLLAGWIGRRLPWRRGRWLAAAIGLLALSLSFPGCGGDDTDPPTVSCDARVGGFSATGDDAPLLPTVAVAMSLAAGVAPPLSAMLRYRDRVRGGTRSDGVQTDDARTDARTDGQDTP